MIKDEALRMAIEALEKSKDILEYEGMIPDGYEEAIQACKEALAETQEPMIIKQENEIIKTQHWLCLDGQMVVAQIYTKPPSREWVGLSVEEIGRLAVFDGLHHVEIPLLAKFIIAIEHALKEKNG